MTVQDQIDRIEYLRNALRIKLMGMDLVGSSADLEECVNALGTVDVHGYTFTSVTDADEWVEVAEGYYPEGCVVGIPTAVAESITGDNIRSGVSFLGRNGTFTSDATASASDILNGKTAYINGKKVTGSISVVADTDTVLDTEDLLYTIPEGMHTGSGTVRIVTEEKTVTPLKNARNVTPSSGKVLSKVTVEAIPDKYQDISTTTLYASAALAGSRFINSEGVVTYGSMPNKGNVRLTFDGIEQTSCTIPMGYHSGIGTVSLTDDIESALSDI